MPPPVDRGTFAEVVGGPADLLAWFEARLGLACRADNGNRLAALCAAMERAIAARRLSPNVASSYSSHPYAVASRMLFHRDAFLIAVPLAKDGVAPPELDVDASDPSALPKTLPTIIRQYNAAIALATQEECSVIRVGEPDRLAMVLHALHSGQLLPACRLVLDDDLNQWPARWQSLLRHLEAESPHVVFKQLSAPLVPQAQVGSALHTVQFALVPGSTVATVPMASSDETLRVVRCASKAVAAQAAASALQSMSSEELSASVVICADDAVAAMIDAHLHAFGLPTMGIATGSQTSGILATLPLAVEAIGSPADPSQVKEFLSLPESPISRIARVRLLKALDDLPAVGSPAWTQVLREIRKRWKKGARQAAIIDEWIPVPRKWCRSRAGFEAAALTAAVARVSRWANRNCRRVKEEIRQTLTAGVSTPADGALLDLTVARSLHFQALFARCRVVLALIEQRKLTGLVDRAIIMQLFDTAHERQVTLAIHPDSAGGPRRVRSLAEIGDFVGAVSRALWVGPVRQSLPTPPWSQGDIAVTKSAHMLELDTTASQLEAVTRAEEAGLCHLSGSLLVVAHPSGDASSRPHPLWLMITEMLRVGMPAPRPPVYEPQLVDSSMASLPLSPWVISQAAQPLDAPPDWITSIALDPSTAMPRRRTVSHSDVEQRLTCPVAWAFRYGASLSRPANAAMPSPEISRGTVGERVLREVFRGAPLRNDAAAVAKLDRVLRRRLPRLHAELCSPMAREAREEIELALRKAVPVLQALISSGIKIRFGARLDRFKDPSGKDIIWQGLSPRGAIDALGTVAVGSDRLPIIIDMKYGSAAHHESRLKQGNCTQLALYSHFVQLRDPTTQVDSIGYLIISEGFLLIPAWASGRLSIPALAGVVRVVRNATSCSLPQLIADLDTRAAAAVVEMHQAGAVLAAHPRAAAAGAPPHRDLAFIHGLNPTKAAQSACIFCQYSLLCGKDRVR